MYVVTVQYTAPPIQPKIGIPRGLWCCVTEVFTLSFMHLYSMLGLSSRNWLHTGLSHWISSSRDVEWIGVSLSGYTHTVCTCIRTFWCWIGIVCIAFTHLHLKKQWIRGACGFPKWAVSEYDEHVYRFPAHSIRWWIGVVVLCIAISSCSTLFHTS